MRGGHHGEELFLRLHSQLAASHGGSSSYHVRQPRLICLYGVGFPLEICGATARKLRM